MADNNDLIESFLGIIKKFQSSSNTGVDTTCTDDDAFNMLSSCLATKDVLEENQLADTMSTPVPTRHTTYRTVGLCDDDDNQLGEFVFTSVPNIVRILEDELIQTCNDTDHAWTVLRTLLANYGSTLFVNDVYLDRRLASTTIQVFITKCVAFRMGQQKKTMEAWKMTLQTTVDSPHRISTSTQLLTIPRFAIHMPIMVVNVTDNIYGVCVFHQPINNMLLFVFEGVFMCADYIAK